MSMLNENLIISPPAHLVRSDQSEVFYGKPVECPHCHGKGVFEKEVSRELSEKILCSICAGSGEIRAKIMIKWEGM